MAVMGGPTDRKMSERRGPLPSGVCSSIRESSRGRSGACVGDSAKPFKGGAAIRPELFIRTNWIGHRQRDVRLSRPVTMSVAPLRRAEFAAENCWKMAPCYASGRCPTRPPGAGQSCQVDAAYLDENCRSGRLVPNDRHVIYSRTHSRTCVHIERPCNDLSFETSHIFKSNEFFKTKCWI